MEKPNQNHNQNQNQTLKCPRCDSSNTKFCYYNNYSLSQPRHFCKACKRYWTRGGTLRNVPVGGGCRRNKRIKRPISAVDPPPSSSTPPATSNPNIQPHIDVSSTSSLINPLFYGLPTNPCELSPPYPSFNSRVSNVDALSGFDLDPQLSALGLGFSSGLIASDVQDNYYRNGFTLSSYSVFGSSSTSTSPTMASLLASSLQRQKFFSNGVKDIQEANSFQGLVSYQGEVKMEEGQNRLDWNVCCQNQMEQISPSDPSVFWNASSVGTLLDPGNIGSSVSSLI